MAESKHPYGGMPFHGSAVIKDGKKVDFDDAYPDLPKTLEEVQARSDAKKRVEKKAA